MKRAKVVEAVANGATYEQVTERAGCATRSGAYKAFWKAVDGRKAEAVEDHRALELERLDALQMPLWEKVMKGDVKAAGMVLRQRDRRPLYLQLPVAGARLGVERVGEGGRASSSGTKWASKHARLVPARVAFVALVPSRVCSQGGRVWLIQGRRGSWHEFSA